MISSLIRTAWFSTHPSIPSIKNITIRKIIAACTASRPSCCCSSHRTRKTMQSVKLMLASCWKAIRQDYPAVSITASIAGQGHRGRMVPGAHACAADHALVGRLGSGSGLATGTQAVVGGWGRLAMSATATLSPRRDSTVQYGPGDFASTRMAHGR